MVVTIRDYDALVQDKPRVTQPNVYDNGKRIVSVWDWADDSKTYILNHFIWKVRLQTLNRELNRLPANMFFRFLNTALKLLGRFGSELNRGSVKFLIAYQAGGNEFHCPAQKSGLSHID